MLLDRLRTLLGAIEHDNPFYAPRLKAAGVTSDLGSVADFSERVPFTTKAQIAADQAAHPPYGSNLTFPVARYTRFCQTSGTTGRPLVFLDTPESWDWMLDNWLRIYDAAGVAPGDRILFAFSFGPFLGFWTGFEAATRRGCLCLPGGGLSSAARIRLLIEHGVSTVCCTPTYALHLAEAGAREGGDFSRVAVNTIIVAGEPGGSVPAVRERISASWNGARVVDHYGMSEVGPTAFESRSGVLRIVDGSYLAEVINPESGAPVPAAESGELVLTPLGRLATPLLRYRTGDLVKRVAESDAFELEGGILGRVDDMIVVRGVNIHPTAVESVVRSIPEIAEYRVNVTRRGVLCEIGLEVESADDSGARRLENALSEAFSMRVPVTRQPSGTLPRFEMKARRWVRHD